MQPVVTPAEMGEADRRTIAAGTPEAVLVERAGAAVARARVAHARRCVRPPGRGRVRPGQQRRRRRASRRAGCGRAASVSTSSRSADGVARGRAAPRARRAADLAIDAMFGTGLSGRARRRRRAGRRARSRRPACATLAVDIPSGVDGTTGEVRGDAVRAGRDGVLRRAQARAALRTRAFARGPRARRRHRDRRAAWPGPHAARARGRRSRACRDAPPTGTSGRRACSSSAGRPGMIGAPLLAGHAAARSGAGMVVCGVPGRRRRGARRRQRARRPARCPRRPTARLDADAADVVLADVERFRARRDRSRPRARRANAGRGAAARRRVPAARSSSTPTRCNALAADPDALRRAPRGRLPARDPHPARGRVRAPRGQGGRRRSRRRRARPRGRGSTRSCC